MLKKNKSISYTSTTYEGHSEQSRLSTAPERLPRLIARAKTVKGGKRSIPKTSRGMVKLGIKDNSRRSIAWHTCANWVERMITLPKITMLAFITLYSLVMFYWLYPYNPVEMETPIKVLSKEVKAGESITLEMTFNKKSDCVPDVKWYLVDGFILRLSEDAVRRPLGDQTRERDIYIPVSAPAEKVHLRIEYSCRVNPLRTIDYSWDTESFLIVNNKP